MQKVAGRVPWRGVSGRIRLAANYQSGMEVWGEGIAPVLPTSGYLRCREIYLFYFGPWVEGGSVSEVAVKNQASFEWIGFPVF